MSKRAKEEAWKAYPKRPEQKYITAFGTFEFDHDAPNREGFIKGYEQAERDLALTAEDVGCIFNLVRQMQVKYNATSACYQEVADIFNKDREDESR